MVNETSIIDLNEHFLEPVPHRFLHGHLKDDPETRFILLLPDPDFWSGRLTQFIEGGMGGYEYIGPEDFGYYTLQNHHAAYVKSNHGHVGDDLSTIGFEKFEKVAYLSNYNTMLCAKEIVKKNYGRYPNFSYVVGGSGGGIRATILLEKYPEIYDGAVAIVQAEFSIIMYYSSLLAKYLPILKPDYDKIVNTTIAGGSKNPYAVLDTQEKRDALRKLYNAGFPRGAEPQMNVPIDWLIVFLQDLLTLTPERVYYQDFWKKKEYAGYDGDVTDSIVEGITGEVVEIHKIGESLSGLPKIDPSVSQPLTINSEMDKHTIPQWPPELLKRTIGFQGTTKFASGKLSGYTVAFKSGILSGKSFHIINNSEDSIFTSNFAAGYPDGISVGDKYEIDNRDLLAFSYYHRHIVTLLGDSYKPQDFLRNNQPAFPQRLPKASESLKMKHSQTGDFRGKMISIFAAQDVIVWPPVLSSYVDLVKKCRKEDLNDYYRFYLVENATHGSPSNAEESFKLVSYSPMIGRASDYLIDWVEKGAPPPPSTDAKLDSNYSLDMPRTAAERKGIQPLISRITANGRTGKVQVPQGNPVKLNSVAQAPTGKIIKYEWYCPNLKDFYYEKYLEKPKANINIPYTYIFQQLGTYFPVARVTSDLDGDPKILGGGQRNLARIRIVVEK